MRLKRLLVVGLAIALPLFVGATSPQLVQRLRVMTDSVLNPILNAQDRMQGWIQEKVGAITELPQLRSKNKVLEARLAEMSREVGILAEFKNENERLRNLLGLKAYTPFRTIPVRVIGRDPSQWASFIVINKGTEDGVREDCALIHADGLVGKVIAAGPKSARAILITDRQSRVGALNQRTRDVGLIEGRGALLLKMNYLDREANFEVGDIIVSSGLGGVYPKGIPIGKVQLIAEDESKMGLYAEIKPNVRFARLEELLCVIS